MMKFKTLLERTFAILKSHPYHVIAVALLFLWCIPYFTTSNRIEYGDFSFFAQNYEAMRTTIFDYHQFPWWNPWMAGGIPLYANPQIGVFSIQTIFVLIFGAIMGLKLSVVAYTLAGYASMYVLLRRYFRVAPYIAMLLSLAWVFCSFFVAHLPAHYTFVWYLLAPLYIYLALTVKNWKGGLLLGLAFAAMALSAVHNPFFHIGLVVAVVMGLRLLFDNKHRLGIFIAGLSAGATLLILAGHRLFLVYQTVQSFDRPAPEDPSIGLVPATLGLFMPFVRRFYLNAIGWYPAAPFSWGEATATAGAFIGLAALVAFFILGFRFISKKYQPKPSKIFLIITGSIILLILIAAGNLGQLWPYWFIKQLPIFGEMRVSTRWLIWAVLALLVFVGLFSRYIQKEKALRRTIAVLCVLGVIELFISNFGYQFNVFQHHAIEAPKNVKSYAFTQIDEFGDKYDFPDRLVPNDGKGPMFYREYEATTFNIGVVRANDPLVDNRYKKARCVEDSGCPFVLSTNAVLTQWSPNKLVLKRTGPGPVVLNVNDSYYYKVNGIRHESNSAAAVEGNLSLPLPDSTQTFTLTIHPNYIR